MQLLPPESIRESLGLHTRCTVSVPWILTRWRQATLPTRYSFVTARVAAVLSCQCHPQRSCAACCAGSAHVACGEPADRTTAAPLKPTFAAKTSRGVAAPDRRVPASGTACLARTRLTSARWYGRPAAFVRRGLRVRSVVCLLVCCLFVYSVVCLFIRWFVCLLACLLVWLFVG
jgi:hypothetical protein